MLHNSERKSQYRKDFNKRKDFSTHSACCHMFHLHKMTSKVFSTIKLYIKFHFNFYKTHKKKNQNSLVL